MFRFVFVFVFVLGGLLVGFFVFFFLGGGGGELLFFFFFCCFYLLVFFIHLCCIFVIAYFKLLSKFQGVVWSHKLQAMKLITITILTVQELVLQKFRIGFADVRLKITQCVY